MWVYNALKEDYLNYISYVCYARIYYKIAALVLK